MRQAVGCVHTVPLGVGERPAVALGDHLGIVSALWSESDQAGRIGSDKASRSKPDVLEKKMTHVNRIDPTIATSLSVRLKGHADQAEVADSQESQFSRDLLMAAMLVEENVLIGAGQKLALAHNDLLVQARAFARFAHDYEHLKVDGNYVAQAILQAARDRAEACRQLAEEQMPSFAHYPSEDVR